MDSLQSIRVFITIVELGSFTKAAERLDISTAMASKHLAHLEKQLHTRLLQRNSRNLHLTEAGKNYYQRSKAALEHLEEAAHLAQAENINPHGLLRITAPVWFSCQYFANIISDYHQHYPNIQLELDLSNRRIDLAADGYDLALRMTNSPREHEIAQPLGTIAFHLVGTKKFATANFEQLSQLPAILPNYTDLSKKALHINGQEQALTLRPILRSNNTLFLHQTIKTGMGIGYLPEWLITEDIAKQRLLKLLPDNAFAPVTLYSIYPHHRFINQKTRSFVEHLRRVIA